MANYWHFLPRDRKLTHRDGRLVKVGETLHAKDKPIGLGEYGLNASESILDALKYAPGLTLCKVELGKDAIHAGLSVPLSVSSSRKCLAMLDATDIILKWSRWCALQVVELWDCPKLVKNFLETGKNADAAARAIRITTDSTISARAAARATRYAARAAVYADNASADYAHNAAVYANNAYYVACANATRADYADSAVSMRKKQESKLLEMLESADWETEN